MRAGGLDAVHVTIAYHEGFRETILNLLPLSLSIETVQIMLLHIVLRPHHLRFLLVLILEERTHAYGY